VYVWFKGWKNGRDGKLFCFIEEKIGRIENVIYINLPLYPYYIMYEIIYFVLIK